jgi:hypothetical protein
VRANVGPTGLFLPDYQYPVSVTNGKTGASMADYGPSNLVEKSKSRPCVTTIEQRSLFPTRAKAANMDMRLMRA